MKFSEIRLREKARAERHIDRDPNGKLRPGPHRCKWQFTKERIRSERAEFRFDNNLNSGVPTPQKLRGCGDV
jgi:hypothetical protein